MRIILVAHNVIRGDGQGRVNLEIARHALSSGHQLRLVAVSVDQEIIKAGAIHDEINVVRRPVLVRVIQFARQVDQQLNRLRTIWPADIIIANGFVTTQVHDLNLCQFVHSTWLRSRRKGDSRGPVDWIYQEMYTRFNSYMEKIVYRNAAKIVTPSHRTAEELSSIGIPANKVSVIRNGVDLAEFKPGRGDRARLGLPVGIPLLLFAGDLRTNRKGLKYVLLALQRIPQAHLIVVGRPTGSPFIRYARDLGVADRVTFLGFRRDMCDVMRACDLFVFPSGYEPFGMVVTEALASGLPVVTTMNTGASELLNSCCGTALIDPSDVERLAKAITDWIEKISRGESPASECRLAVQGVTWSATSAQYFELIEGLKGGPHFQDTRRARRNVRL